MYMEISLPETWNPANHQMNDWFPLRQWLSLLILDPVLLVNDLNRYLLKPFILIFVNLDFRTLCGKKQHARGSVLSAGATSRGNSAP
jgi:hypothetical protein